MFGTGRGRRPEVDPHRTVDASRGTPEVGTAPAAVELRDVTVRYGSSAALESLSLVVRRGECLALLGPSGSGKSTALNAIAGFVRPTSGTVVIGGKDMTDVAPARRGLGFVVQSYALFPTMSVRDNIAFGLSVRKVKSAARRARVEEVAALVGMADYLDRRPAELSGGQQQRVAMARALAPNPDVLLLDEPMSALDSRLRESVLDELLRLRRELPDVAMIMVTHDQKEAMALADRIAVLRDGRCEAYDTTQQLFFDPPTPFTATFLGGAALLPGTVATLATVGPQPAADRAVVDVLGLPVPVRLTSAHAAGEAVTVAVRPWHWRISATRPDVPGWFTGEVVSEQWRGSTHHCRVRITGAAGSGSEVVPVDLPGDAERPTVGQAVWLSPQPDLPTVVDSDADPAIGSRR